MNFTLQQIAHALGMEAPENTRITGWSIDTRTLVPGDLFIALRGPNHDANAYLDEAFARGASAAIAQCRASGPVLVVPDALQAMQQLAAWARDQWGGDIIGVTGSAGKTSTKDVIASLLATEVRVGKTSGNFNNHVGLPLSVLRLPDEARLAVLEYGMNHGGEIRDLTQIAKPFVAVVTNVGYAHIENFNSIEGIAAAKRELVEALPRDGVAVLNADDPHVAGFTAGRSILYGLSPAADLRAEDIEFASEVTRFRVCQTRFETTLLGRHGIRNILAGIAVAGLYGISPERLRDAVRELKPGAMRGERFYVDGILILNDCYNSNPDAARAMIDVLRDTPARRRIAVLGEMLELGDWSERLHRDVGRYVAESGINVVVGVRGAARYIVDEAIVAGVPSGAAFFFERPGPAGDLVREIARANDAILFKGSRGTHVELALESFRSVQVH